MTPEEALGHYRAGPEAVVKVLCEMSATMDALREKVKTLEGTVERLEKKVAQLSKNSSTSSKPPSSDDITKPKRKKKGPGRIGGQPGHPRNERRPFAQEEIDESHDYTCPCCPACHGQVTLVDGEPRVIQQLEIKEIPVVKYEHRSYPMWCKRCQKLHYAPLPAEVVREGLFKERLTALVAYMKQVCHASFTTIRKFIRDILGVKVSRAYLCKVIEKVGQALEAPYQELLDRLPLEERLNVDETGHKDNGERFWTWVFKAELYVLFKIDRSRGSKVLIDVLGKEFEGVLGCDYFSAYRKYMTDFNVCLQFCIAHLIRDIRFLLTLPDRASQAYGRKLLAAIKKMFAVIHQREKMSPAAFQQALEDAKATIMIVALNDVPSRLNKDGKESKTEVRNIANRFRTHGHAYFTFITTPGMDPTNNVAEQAMRFIIIDRHITQGTRSSKGRQRTERLWTVIATCGLQGRSAFQFIHKAVHAYFHGQPSPSLIPLPP